MESVSKSVS